VQRGGFAYHLATRDFRVVVVDASPAMTVTARRAYSEQVEFRVADAATFAGLSQFDIVTAIMVFQFVEDIAGLLRQLAGVLREGGLLAFAVFNPAYVAERIAAGRTFLGFDSGHRPDEGLHRVQRWGAGADLCPHRR
jgi:trans-aconitate methyltransferase